MSKRHISSHARGLPSSSWWFQSFRLGQNYSRTEIFETPRRNTHRYFRGLCLPRLNSCKRRRNTDKNLHLGLWLSIVYLSAIPQSSLTLCVWTCYYGPDRLETCVSSLLRPFCFRLPRTLRALPWKKKIVSTGPLAASHLEASRPCHDTRVDGPQLGNDSRRPHGRLIPKSCLPVGSPMTRSLFSPSSVFRLPLLLFQEHLRIPLHFASC